MLQAFIEQYSGEDFKEAPTPKEGALFHRCTFHKLNGATLKNCKLYGSKFAMTKAQDIIGLTVTMDCDSFNNVELSPEVLDYLLLLICKSSGNVEKRRTIIEKVVGHDRAVQLLRELETLEN